MHNATHSPGGRQQRGWILVIGLVVLVMLSIIAIALMRTTMMEEKMAGANRDINLAFEAAETALRGAEIFIESQSDDSLFATTSTGIYAQGTDPGNTEPNAFLTPWSDTNSRILATKLNNLLGKLNISCTCSKTPLTESWFTKLNISCTCGKTPLTEIWFERPADWAPDFLEISGL